MSQQRCFAVSKKRRIDESEEITFDDIDQMDAQTYLSRVVAQADRLPEHFTVKTETTTTTPTSTITTKRNHSSGFSASSSSSAASLAYLLSAEASLTRPSSTAVLPAAPREWVDATCADFAALRAHLETLHQLLGRRSRSFPYTLPTLKDRAAWHVFCVGAAEAEGNVGSYFGDDDHDEEEEEQQEEDENTVQSSKANDPTIQAEQQLAPNDWRLHLPPNGYPPETRLLLQMDQVMVRRILSHLAYYSKAGWQMTVNRAAWCYALLACLETPLHREQAVVLYEWCKALTAQRAQLEPSNGAGSSDDIDKSKMSPCASINTILTIIVIYFEQGGGFDAVMQVKKSQISRGGAVEWVETSGAKPTPRRV